MKRAFQFMMALMLSSLLISCSNYKYESVKNDPLNARIYTLDNGLKVYMTVNKETPRIQASIAVKVGGKNDPAETTGLAHYFEHLMFKGTESFGTQNYEAEKPLLDEIEKQFEIYRNTSNRYEREDIYRVIDSLSFEASKYAIPNEYDKLMSTIGSNMTNAYTSYDETVYIEDIPSNQIENWAKIQADRFAHNVIRGFHTELETVYEEKNMSLVSDSDKLYEAIFSSLFHNHPYGTQTVLGTQEHLKNPSITNIKNYYKEWYVANNIAICLSGDFNPDKMIKVIDKYFSVLPTNPDLQKIEFKPEDPIVQPIVTQVNGREAEMVAVAWRLPAMNHEDSKILDLMSQVLYNGSTGLIDQNVNQPQLTLGLYGGTYSLADHSLLMIMGYPQTGQTLDEVRDIILEQIDLLKGGQFSEELLPAIVNNMKLREMKSLENNFSRADKFVTSFIYDVPWEDMVNELDEKSKITKEDIVECANRYLSRDNYVCVNKLQGGELNESKIDKPQITPLEMNRDAKSEFFAEIQNSEVEPIEPQFLDYSKDLSILTNNNNFPIYYKQNSLNGLFELTYQYDFGTNEDKALRFAFNYLDFIGTSQKSALEVKEEFFKLACSLYTNVSNDKVSIRVSGLSDNMEKAMALVEEVLTDPKADEEALAMLKQNMIEERAMAKLSQRSINNALISWATYGERNPINNVLSDKEIVAMGSEELITRIKNMQNLSHEILYYGPLFQDEFVRVLNANHKTAVEPLEVAKNESFKQQIVETPVVYIAPYEAKQITLTKQSIKGEKYNPEIAPIHSLYNEYFGGGMNAIVFQEMREARGLAYSANARLSSPLKLSDSYVFRATIATQNDKMMDALSAFDSIINDMPVSENAFNIAKDALITRLRTQRVTGSRVIYNYLNAKELGLDYDINKIIFEQIDSLTLEDVVGFQQEWVKDRVYKICIVGDEDDLDMRSVKNYGNIERVSLNQLFGY